MAAGKEELDTPRGLAAGGLGKFDEGGDEALADGGEGQFFDDADQAPQTGSHHRKNFERDLRVFKAVGVEVAAEDECDLRVFDGDG